MKKETLRDETLSVLEGFLKNRWFDRACWAVIVIAILYFGPVVIEILIK